MQRDELAPFRAHPLLPGRHLQTIFQVYLRWPSVPSTRHLSIPTPDGDWLDLFVDSEERSPTAPVVLIGHGLEGNERSPYVRGLCDLLRPLGWLTVVQVQRSCGPSMNLTRRLYHTGETEDLGTVVRWLVERWPERPLFIVGHSLSGNQLCKWLGTSADVPANLVAAAAISPPFDLTASARTIERAALGVYRRHFLRTLVPKGLAKARQFPGSLDLERLRSIRTLRDFDDAVTAPLHGFRDAADYYAKSGCGQFLSEVRRPLLLVAAEDDPFNPGDTLPRRLAATHPFIEGRFTRTGGHVGFVASRRGWPSYWAENEVVQFLLGKLSRR